MTSIFSDDALHPGRDPNDSSWQILRRPHDWKDAVFHDARYDDTRMVIELSPIGLAPNTAGCLEVCAPDGTCYRCDPEHDLVLVGSCGVFAPLAGFGGHGVATGQLRRPSGLALDDRGLLYVADTDNHRVQVVRTRDGHVEIVLGASNAWGDPIAGVDHGAMTRPVAVAVGPRAIYVADPGAQAVHVFDRAFRWQRSFAPAPRKPPAGFTAKPIAVALGPQGELLVADLAWPLFLAFAPDGSQLPDVAFDDSMVPCALSCLGGSARFAMRGEVTVGPIDGLVEDLPWHRVLVDARIPAGATITVQTYANETSTPTDPIPWAPVAPVAMPLRRGAKDGVLERPVLSDVGRWQRARHGAYRRVSPLIATYTGDGPDAIATLVLSGDGLARVRAGDEIELVAAAPSNASERVVVIDVPPRTVQLSAAGTVAAFGPGTDITLLERDGAEPFGGPRTLYQLESGETIDLTTVHTDGTLEDIHVPHAAAALWRRGDLLSIGTATVSVAEVRAEPVTVALAGPLTADYRKSTVRIVEAEDRLFVRDATGLDAAVPAAEPITVSGLTAGTPWTAPATIAWVEPELGAVWLAPATTIAWDDWESFTTPVARATDRGRYLWLRLVLTGAAAHADDLAATATPTIRAVRLLRPRLSYLRYLPATYARRDNDDPTGALFLERMLGLFEHELTKIESRYESVARQLDPFASDPEWLKFLAAWFELYLDPDLPIARKRLLVAEAHALYAMRGTPEGIRRYIEIVTGESPRIVEGFQVRPRSGLVLGCHGVLGCAALGGLDDETAASPAFLERYAHRFTIFVFVDDPCRLEAVETAMRLLVESIKPAHTLVDLQVLVPDARVGVHSTVGIDTVLGDDRLPPQLLGANITLR